MTKMSGSMTVSHAGEGLLRSPLGVPGDRADVLYNHLGHVLDSVWLRQAPSDDFKRAGAERNTA